MALFLPVAAALQVRAQLAGMCGRASWRLVFTTNLIYQKRNNCRHTPTHICLLALDRGSIIWKYWLMIVKTHIWCGETKLKGSNPGPLAWPASALTNHKQPASSPHHPYYCLFTSLHQTNIFVVFTFQDKNILMSESYEENHRRRNRGDTGGMCPPQVS